MMTPALRRTNLVAHVVSSVGWLGAVVSFLALSVIGLRSTNPQGVRSAYLAMDAIGQFVIVPLSVLSLATGLVQSLGTHWGLVRHYWVLTKFALTVVATSLLLLHQFTAVASAAERAATGGMGVLPDVGRLGTQLVFDAAFAVVVLLFTTTLSVFKPWGRTRYSQVREPVAGRRLEGVAAEPTPRGVQIMLAAVGLIVLTIIVLHLTGRGLGRHGM